MFATRTGMLHISSYNPCMRNIIITQSYHRTLLVALVYSAGYICVCLRLSLFHFRILNVENLTLTRFLAHLVSNCGVFLLYLKHDFLKITQRW